jgi:hypothetical protein
VELKYQITRDMDRFVVFDSEHEFMGVFESEEEAQRDIAREQQDDAIWDRAQELVRHAVITITGEFAVDQETALHWVNSATGMTPLGMEGPAKP